MQCQFDDGAFTSTLTDTPPLTEIVEGRIN